MGSILAEWLLLSMCDYFVITESGFAKTSVAYNINMPKMFLFRTSSLTMPRGSATRRSPAASSTFTDGVGYDKRTVHVTCYCKS